MRRALIALGCLVVLVALAPRFADVMHRAAPGPAGYDAPPGPIPSGYLALYREASAAYGLPWELLAAIGTVETSNGQNPAMYSPNSKGAIGPMQFLPSTFARYGSASGSSTPNILDPRDSIYAAAAMLRANGAPGDTRRAVFAYNRADWYVDKVIGIEAYYTQQAGDV